MVKGRFAPSPTGRMHLGNVYSALLSWLSAKSQGGTWLLRIEDLDPQRSKMEYARQVEDDLRWLGLTWDEGGLDAGCVQSQRHEIYEEYLARLTAMGLTYPCYCTRADIMATQAPHESDGRIVYKGTCRPSGMTAPVAGASIMSQAHSPQQPIMSQAHSPQQPINGRRGATRLIVPDEAITFVDGHYGQQSINLAEHCGDFVLRRADGAWAYQLAVVVDDALMGVTEVVRGCDLLLSVPQQLYLYRLLGFEAPRFSHIPLLCNESGQRLCKRDKSLDMGCLRESYTPEDIIGTLAYYAGLTQVRQPISAAELIDIFDWSKIPQTSQLIVQNSQLIS